jgi:hypothetical protein
MYEKMKPKRCIYKGIVFQSKLEARWAVVFDALNIRWIYEPETLHCKWGDEDLYYRPDFYLPDISTYVEVKPTDDALRQKADVIGMMVDWEGPLSRGIMLLGPIPDSTKLAYKIPYFSYLIWDTGVWLNYAALVPEGLHFVNEWVECCEGEDGFPDGTSVEPQLCNCADKALLKRLIDAYHAGWYSQKIEVLNS